MPTAADPTGMSYGRQGPGPAGGHGDQLAQGPEKLQARGQGPENDSEPHGGQGAQMLQAAFSTGPRGAAAVFHSSQGTGAWVAVLEHQGQLGTFATMAAAMAAVYAATAAAQ